MEEPKAIVSKSNSSDNKCLPFCLITGILSKLPFTLVTKLWYSFIRIPNFIKTRTEINPSIDPEGDSKTAACSYIFQMPSKLNPFENHSYTLLDEDEFIENETFDIPVVYGRLHLCFIGNSCNGVICCAYDGELYGRMVFLFNPSVRKIDLISHNSIVDEIYDGHKVHTKLGFGYCESSREHKVVRIHYIEDEKLRMIGTVPPRVEVYSSGSDCWRQLIADIKCLVSFDTVYCNGNIYWLATKGRGNRIYGSGDDTLLSFDVTNEEFNEIELPPACNPVLDGTILVYNGSLALFSRVDDPVWNCYAIWVMEKPNDSSSWSQIYLIETTNIITKAFGCTSGGKVVMIMDDREMACWDPEENSVKYQKIYNSSNFHVDAAFVDGLVTSAGIVRKGANLASRKYVEKPLKLKPNGRDIQKVKIQNDDVIVRIATDGPQVDNGVNELRRLCSKKPSLVVVTGRQNEEEWTVQLTTTKYSLIVQRRNGEAAPASLARFMASPHEVCFVQATTNSLHKVFPEFGNYAIELGDIIEELLKQEKHEVLKEAQENEAIKTDYFYEGELNWKAIPLPEEEAKRFIYRAYVFYTINYRLFSSLEHGSSC